MQPVHGPLPREFWFARPVRRALGSCDMPALIEAVRAERGWSQAELAATLGYSQPWVSRVVRGQLSLTLEQVRHVAGRLGIPLDRLRFSGDDAAADVVAWWYEASDAADMGASESEVIREMTRTFRRLDNRFGGGHAHRVASAYLNGDVATKLRELTLRGDVPGELLAAIAELTHLVGWTAHDIGADQRARAQFKRSLQLARAADDDAYAGEVLAGMSHQASYLRDGGAAVDMARAASTHAERAGVPALESEAAAMAAHGHALLGDRAASLAAMRTAERALGRDQHQPRPQWLAFMDEAYLAAKFAHALLALRDLEPAERFAERSLHMSDGYERGRLFNTALLASVHAERGDVDAACALGGDAIGMTQDMQSARCLGYLADLHRRLAQHRTEPAVRELTERLRPLARRAPTLSGT